MGEVLDMPGNLATAGTVMACLDVVEQITVLEIVSNQV
jgi:hypothetical protein